MPFIFIILGIYAVAVALHGNTGVMADELIKTTSGFIVWAVAVTILVVIATKGPEPTRRVGMAFLGLALIGFILANGKGLIAQSQHFVSFVQQAGSHLTQSSATQSPTMPVIQPLSAVSAGG